MDLTTEPEEELDSLTEKVPNFLKKTTVTEILVEILPTAIL
jgi:hypothetical protein